jgi:predicted phage terminase large subunit-like protein
MSRRQGQKLLRAIEANKAEASMHYFLEHVVWPTLEPGTEFVDNWHIHAVCDHAEAVVKGGIRNLVVNLPPRFMKSLTLSVGLHVWGWARDPSLRYIFASYGADLALRDAEKARTVIKGPIFQALYGDKFKLKSSEDAKNRFTNNLQGHRVSTSVSGMGTGEGGDIIVADDPHNVKEAESDAVRNSVLTWWDETMSSRLNDPKTGRKVIVMQRVHEKDLSGHVLAKGGYEHVMVPMRFEESRKKSSVLGVYDPREKDGELAWPTRFDEPSTKNLETAMGSYGSAGQLQQRPAPRGGGFIKSEWFSRRWRSREEFSGLQKVASLDLGATDKEGASWSVRGEFAIDPVAGVAYLIDVWRKRLEYPELKRSTFTWMEETDCEMTLIENKSAGIQIIQEHSKNTKIRHKPVHAVNPHKSKVERALLESPAMESKRLILPAEAVWLNDYEQELTSFPKGEDDDQVDMTSQFLMWWRERKFGPISAAAHSSLYNPIGNRTFTGSSRLGSP